MFTTVRNLLRIKPFQILLTIFCFTIVSPYLTVREYNFLYTISVLSKDSLLFILPFTIFAYISTSLMQLKSKASLLILVLIIFEAVSNASSVFYAYMIHRIIPLNELWLFNPYEAKHLTSYLRIIHYKPAWWSAEKGAILGLIVGLYGVYSKKSHFWFQYLDKSKEIANFIFTQIFARLIPIIIPGFVANLTYNNTLVQLLAEGKMSFILMFLATIIYIWFLYFVGSGFRIKAAIRKSCNSLPSLVTAFTTMCSIMTMPLTIANAKKNLKNPKYAEMIIPMTTNVQMIGDCFANAFLCLVVMKMFGYELPNLIKWSKFTFIFTIVRYATSGVSGGTTFLLLPLYEKYLSFNNEMLAIMLTLNTVLDPFITAANVYANGALILIFEKLFNFISLFSVKRVKQNDPTTTESNNI